MDVFDLIARLKELVPDLSGRVQGAADLLRLMKSDADPTVTPIAFVVPAGIMGGEHRGLVGYYVQPIERLYTVVLILRADSNGTKVLDRIEALVWAVIDAVAGWDIGLTSLFVFKRAQLIPSRPGSLAYEINFTITDRIKKAVP